MHGSTGPATLALNVLVVVLLQCIIGCTSDAAPDSNSAENGDPRIVSLSPAISRTLADLGLADHLVGRTPFCDAVNPAVAVVGDLRDVDHERLVKLSPTHLLIQPPAGGVSPALSDLAERHGWDVRTWKLDSIDDIERLIVELPQTFSDSNPAVAQHAAERAEALTGRLREVLRPLDDTAWRGRTLIVAGTDPVLVYGRGTYLDDLLTAMNVPNATDARNWSQLSMEDLTRIDPETVVLLSAGAHDDVDPIKRAGPIGALDITAVREQRLALLRHRDAILPSSAVVEVAEELRGIFAGFAETAADQHNNDSDAGGTAP